MIKQSEHNIFQDRIDGLIRYRCKTNEYFSVGDKVEVIGMGFYIKGTATTTCGNFP